MKKTNKDNLKSMGILIAIITLVSLSYGTYFLYEIDGILMGNIDDNLQALTKAHADHINTYLHEKVDNVGYLSSDYYVNTKLKEINERGYSEETTRDLSEHILGHKVIEDGDFYEVFVLDAQGREVASTNLNKEFGGEWPEIFEKARSESYIGEFAYEDEFGKEGIVIASPIVDTGEFVGIMVFRLDINNLVNLVKNIRTPDDIDPLGVGELGDLYLVNTKRLMITPARLLKGENWGVLVQEVHNVNVDKCLEEIEMGYYSSENDVTSYLDYGGREVIGAYKIIPKTNWCLIAEINKDEMIRKQKMELAKGIVFLFVSILLISVLFFCCRILRK